MDKKQLLENIHKLVSHNIIGDKQLMNRYKGFRGELFFEELLAEKYPRLKRMEGGIILSRDSSKSSLDHAIYITVIPSSEDITDYLPLYSKLSKLDFEHQYLVLYSDETWQETAVMEFEEKTIKLPVPELKILRLDVASDSFVDKGGAVSQITDFFKTARKREEHSYRIKPPTKSWLLENLNQFSREDVLNIYMNRLFFDGFIGYSQEKGKSSDIDIIVKKPEKGFRFIEIKEKDLPKKAKKGFGLDVPRIDDMLRIEELTGIPYHLAVRHINNQKERKFLEWKYISVQDFYTDVKDDKKVMGGTGMRSRNSENPTLICSYDLFKDL